MTELSYFLTDYVKGELLILIPVLYTLSAFSYRFSISKKKTAALLLFTAVFLSSVYTFATTEVTDVQSALSIAFTSVVQGVLVAGIVVFGNSLINKIQDKKTDRKNDENKT